MTGNWKRLVFGSLLVVVFAFGFCGAALASPTVEVCIDGASCTTPILLGTHTVGTTTTSVYTVLLPDGWSVSATIVASNSPGLGPVFGLSLTDVAAQCLSASCVGLSNSLDVLGTDTGFMPELGLVTTFSGSQANMTATQLAYLGPGNTPFGTGHEIGQVGPFSGTSFNGTKIDGASGTSPYSLTIDDIFTASFVGASDTSTGDITATPEPRSVLLFGTGLLLFGTILRRRLLA